MFLFIWFWVFCWCHGFLFRASVFLFGLLLGRYLLGFFYLSSYFLGGGEFWLVFLLFSWVF